MSEIASISMNSTSTSNWDKQSLFNKIIYKLNQNFMKILTFIIFIGSLILYFYGLHLLNLSNHHHKKFDHTIKLRQTSKRMPNMVLWDDELSKDFHKTVDYNVVGWISIAGSLVVLLLGACYLVGKLVRFRGRKGEETEGGENTCEFCC